MVEPVQTLRLGAATVRLFNVGDAQFRLGEVLDVPREAWAPRYEALFTRTLRSPIQCVHIQLPETSVLIDAGAYDFPPDSPYAIPGYRPPPDLLTQLTEAGVQPEEIERVVFTHAHFDHYNGATVERDGSYRPCFPRARHYLGKADWEDAELQSALREPVTPPGRVLAVLDGHGLLEPIAGDREVCEGVRILAAPGETPGHQIVRLHSEGETLYGLGDLFHHPIEFEHPDWTVHWADGEVCRASRRAVLEAALREQAWLVATHIAGVGRLERRLSGGVRWREVP